MEGIHADDLPKIAKTFDDCFSEKLPFELKYRVLHPGKGYVWLHNKAKPNFTPEGQFIGYIGSCVVVNDVLDEYEIPK